MKHKRPHRHIRKIRTKQGTKLKMINPEVPITVQKQIIHNHFDEIRNELEKEGRVRLDGLGILKVRSCPARAARMGRNPFTGEEIKIKAKPKSKKVGFRSSKELKELF